jgi:DNA-directed RNA polymerase subunit RPC12/RpoP
MRCARCGGLMVREKFEDLDGLWSIDHEFTGWRCLNCGSIVDAMIVEHKRFRSPAMASIGH